MEKEKDQSHTFSFPIEPETGLGIYREIVTFYCQDLKAFERMFERVCLLKSRMELHLRAEKNNFIKNENNA